ncbi:glycosyltransferase family 8 protein [Niallia sp. XMNu-256]|uniref:glycosyltransferase family 8 protein n=1 Tax=Niallia sp. XMNu-256 TaxID=3082444 RepID=UPI0030D4C4A7
MNILVTLDSHYLKPLRVMLKSLFFNHQGEHFDIYLLHSRIKDEEITELQNFIHEEGHELFVIKISNDYFKDAPIIKHYSREMYYRLLAFQFLPSHLEKILYLDPDILIINEIRSLYDMDISEYMYAAAYHDRVSVKEINRLRLWPYEIDAYFNSGVLLMNLTSHRKEIEVGEIFDFVAKNKKRLILPDQDILNALYSKKIKQVDEVLYNYDPRFFHFYKLASDGLYDMDYIIHHTSIIHFCGKRKPWHKQYTGKFQSLYKHYERLAFSERIAMNPVS